MKTNAPLVTREQLAAVVSTEDGIPLTVSRIEKEAMRGTGPKPIAKFGKQYMYEKEAARAWARGLLKPLQEVA